MTIAANDRDNTVRATFTNEFSAGELTLSKVLEGAGKDASYATEPEFAVDVKCALDDPEELLFSRTVQIKGGADAEIETADGEPLRLPRGARCWATESATGGATSHTVDKDTFEKAAVVTENDEPDELQALKITATNTYDLGSVDLTKRVNGSAKDYVSGQTYPIEVSCTLEQNGQSTMVLDKEKRGLKADHSVRISDLPIGARCWAVETDNGGATTSAVDFSAPTEATTVVATDTPGIVVTNTFAAGELTVTKKVKGKGPGPFSFQLACTTPRGPVALEAKDATFTLKTNATRTISVPFGSTCTVRETNLAKGVKVAYYDTSGKTGDGQVEVADKAAVTITNTFPVSTEGDQQGTGGNTDGNTGGNTGGPGTIQDNQTPASDNQSNNAGSGLLGALPNTGGPALGLLVAGLLLLGGAALLRRRRSQE